MSDLAKITIIIGKYAILLLMISIVGCIIAALVWLLAIEAAKEVTDSVSEKAPTKENKFIHYQIEEIPKSITKTMNKSGRKVLSRNIITGIKTKKRKVG
jgi:hypothetical protein